MEQWDSAANAFFHKTKHHTRIMITFATESIAKKDEANE
jgi:hypothetical protein